MLSKISWISPCWGETKASQVTNDEKGITSLIKKMQKLSPVLIVVEATGGYQRAVVLGLYEAGLPVAVVNPARVRQYARACGLLAKTDKLDAFNLAEFGKQMKPIEIRAPLFPNRWSRTAILWFP